MNLPPAMTEPDFFSDPLKSFHVYDSVHNGFTLDVSKNEKTGMFDGVVSFEVIHPPFFRYLKRSIRKEASYHGIRYSVFQEFHNPIKAPQQLLIPLPAATVFGGGRIQTKRVKTTFLEADANPSLCWWLWLGGAEVDKVESRRVTMKPIAMFHSRYFAKLMFLIRNHGGDSASIFKRCFTADFFYPDSEFAALFWGTMNSWQLWAMGQSVYDIGDRMEKLHRLTPWVKTPIIFCPDIRFLI